MDFQGTLAARVLRARKHPLTTFVGLVVVATTGAGALLAGFSLFTGTATPERGRLTPSPFSPVPAPDEKLKTTSASQSGHKQIAIAHTPPQLAEVQPTKLKHVTPETGLASWYEIQATTASGEAMDDDALTAAHPSLPLGTRVRVENLDNGRSVVVRINDRGPFARNRIIDLSKTAAGKLDMIADGVANVRVSGVEPIVSADSPR